LEYDGGPVESGGRISKHGRASQYRVILPLQAVIPAGCGTFAYTIARNDYWVGVEMPNIGTLLKSEISRLSRREIRREVGSVKKSSAAHRRDIAALKRQVAALTRQAAALGKRAASVAESAPAALPERPVRFVAKGFRSLRARLGLSAPQLARLLGVSEQSVYNWETKKATPRKEQLAAIIALRGVGKREVQERLEASKAPAKAKGRKAAKKVAKKAAKKAGRRKARK
jgi:DNA-binding transcriptional regulator YiaG